MTFKHFFATIMMRTNNERMVRNYNHILAIKPQTNTWTQCTSMSRFEMTTTGIFFCFALFRLSAGGQRFSVTKINISKLLIILPTWKRALFVANFVHIIKKFWLKTRNVFLYSYLITLKYFFDLSILVIIELENNKESCKCQATFFYIFYNSCTLQLLAINILASTVVCKTVSIAVRSVICMAEICFWNWIWNI